MAMHIFNGLLDIFIRKLEAEVIAGSGHPQSYPLPPGNPLLHSYHVLSIQKSRSGVPVVPLTTQLKNSVMTRIFGPFFCPACPHLSHHTCLHPVCPLVPP